MKILILLSSFLLIIPAHAQADKPLDCKKTNDVVKKFGFITNDPELEERKFIAEQLLNPDGLMIECVYLQEQKVNQPNRVIPLTSRYQPFTDQSGTTPSLETVFDQCQKSSCKHYDGIQSLLMTVCQEDLHRTQQDCEKLMKPTVIINHFQNVPLPTWRKVVGGILIGIGGATAILGATHMGVPVFRSEDGCVKYGLEHACLTASRFGAGGALLGVGLAAVGGGIFTLTWPTAESKVTKVTEQEKIK